MIKTFNHVIILEKSEEMKSYYFLAGLPRSGNTLLSSILNQNPDLMVSANSFMCDHLFATAKFQFDSRYKNFPDEKSLINLIQGSFESYYKDWEATHIIDRGPWGTPPNLFILQNYLIDEPKIIVTVRDIVEIITSFIRVNPKQLMDLHDEQVKQGKRFLRTYKDKTELMCEMAMDPTGQIEHALFSLSNLLEEENRKYLHIVEYNDLVNDTENTIKSIYEFLELDYYSHNYNYIHQFSVNGIEYDDSFYGGDLHKVKKKIKPKKYEVSDYLPPHLIKRYSNIEFWK